MEHSKQHFIMYKAGKHWVFAGVFAFASAMGMSATTSDASADDLNETGSEKKDDSKVGPTSNVVTLNGEAVDPSVLNQTAPVAPVDESAPSLDTSATEEKQTDATTDSEQPQVPAEKPAEEPQQPTTDDKGDQSTDVTETSKPAEPEQQVETPQPVAPETKTEAPKTTTPQKKVVQKAATSNKPAGKGTPSGPAVRGGIFGKDHYGFDSEPVDQRINLDQKSSTTIMGKAWVGEVIGLTGSKRYQWYKYQNGTWVAIKGANSETLEVKPGAVGTEYYQLQADWKPIIGSAYNEVWSNVVAIQAYTENPVTKGKITNIRKDYINGQLTGTDIGKQAGQNAQEIKATGIVVKPKLDSVPSNGFKGKVTWSYDDGGKGLVTNFNPTTGEFTVTNDRAKVGSIKITATMDLGAGYNKVVTSETVNVTTGVEDQKGYEGDKITIPLVGFDESMTKEPIAGTGGLWGKKGTDGYWVQWYEGDPNDKSTWKKVGGLLKDGDLASKSLVVDGTMENNNKNYFAQLITRGGTADTFYPNETANQAQLDSVSFVTGASKITVMPLADAIEDAKAQIDKLPNLQIQEKDDFKSTLDQATKIDDVRNTLNEAKQKDAANLKAAKDAAKKELPALELLTPKQHNGYQERIDAADTIDEVNGILDEAKASQAAKEALNKHKQEIKQKIADMAGMTVDGVTYPGISDLQKQNYEDALDGADLTHEMLDAYFEQVKKLNDKQALSAAQEGVGQLLIEIVPKETDCNAYNDRVKNATTADDLEQILADARDSDTKAAKKDATDAINALEDLTAQEKNDFLDRVNKSNSVKEITGILTEAREKDEANRQQKLLDETKNKAKEAINGMAELGDEAADFKKRVDAATSIDEVKAIATEASKRNAELIVQKQLETAKEAGKNSVNELEYLSDEEKQDFIAQIEAGKTIEEVNTIVNKAKQLDATHKAEREKEFQELKDKANQQIDDLKDLTDLENKDFKEMINQLLEPTDENLAELKKILKDAQMQDEMNRVQKQLDAAKEEAKKKIADMNYLTNKDELNRQIDAAVNGDEVSEIWSNAVIENERLRQENDLKKLKEESIKQIDALTNVSQDAKDAAKQIVQDSLDAKTINDQVIALKDLDTQIGNKKIEANKTLKDFNGLRDADVIEFQDRVNGATSLQEIDDILTEAKTKSDDNELQLKKEAALEEIKNMGFLDENSIPGRPGRPNVKNGKDYFANNVNNAKTTKEIEDALKAARDADNAEHYSQQSSVLEALNEAKNIGEHLDIYQKIMDMMNDAINATQMDAIYDVIDAKEAELLQNAKDSANATVDSLTNLDDATKQKIKQQIADGTLGSSILEIADLAKAQDAALSVVEGLQNIDQATKNKAKQDIINATTELNVQEIADAAKAQDAANLKKSQTDAEAAVNALQHLTLDEKKRFTDQIADATKIVDVDQIVADAKALDTLKGQKEVAKETVDALENITPERKAEINATIDGAKDKAAIDQLVTDAQAEDARNLADSQKAGKEAVDALQNLDEVTKQAIKDQIDQAKKIVDVNALVENAKDQDAKTLKQNQDRANDVIGQLPNLSDAQKQEFQNRVNGATTIEDVKKIREEAEALDKLLGQKQAAKEVVDALANISDERKQIIKEAIDKAQDEVTINKLVEDAKAEDQANLVARQDNGSAIVDALPNISESRKQNIKEAIKNATKIVDVDKLVSDAQTEDAENLKRAQTNGKQTVGDLDKLDDSRKKGFQDRIDAAATIDEVDAIVKEAIAANVLQRQKDAAKEIVEKLPNLREETRDSALQGIDDALTKEQIDKLVEDAKLEDQTELKKHQEIAKDRVENFPNLDDARKQEIKDAIDASDNIAEIDQIVADAKAEDSGNLEDAINAGKGTVDKLPSLKDDVKQQLKDKLDAAETVQEVKDILDDAKAQDILQGQKDAAKP
ncbi:KxYKxGKxW signal peptide domain-containing protein [Weissella viridescens]